MVRNISKINKIITLTKLPTGYKTKKHKCSQCENTDASKYPISEKDVRWLCPNCVRLNNRRDNKERPNFVKASKLLHKFQI